MWGLALHSWEQLSLWALALTGLTAVAVFVTQRSVVMLQRQEAEIARRELEEYKLSVEAKVADAMTEGIEAGKTASDAQLKAAELERQAAQLRYETALANARAIEAQAQLARFKAPRTLSKEQQMRIAEAMKQFAGQKYCLGVVPGDEPANLLRLIDEALVAGQWIRTPPPAGSIGVNMTMGPVAINAAPFSSGVLIVSAHAMSGTEVDTRAAALARVLIENGIMARRAQAHSDELKDNPTDMEIVVAGKPFVVPRRLNKHQIKTIADFLSKHSPQKFEMEVSNYSPEADFFATDIQKALEDGGWQLESRTYASNLLDGIRSMAVRPIGTPPNQDRNNPSVEVLFGQAFREANVQMAMGPGSAWTATATRETFIISIGKLPGDD